MREFEFKSLCALFDSYWLTLFSWSCGPDVIISAQDKIALIGTNVCFILVNQQGTPTGKHLVATSRELSNTSQAVIVLALQLWIAWNTHEILTCPSVWWIHRISTTRQGKFCGLLQHASASGREGGVARAQPGWKTTCSSNSCGRGAQPVWDAKCWRLWTPSL